MPTSKPKPCGQLKKVIAIENITFNVPLTYSNIEAIVINLPTRDKPMVIGVDIAVSVTEIGNKIYKLSRHNEAIANAIYGRQEKEVIKAELQNLEQYII